MDRRELASRGTWWARRLAEGLVRSGVSPNAISMASVGFAALAGGAFLLVQLAADGLAERLLFFAGALFIQLRLLCNLMDGMVAVEGGRKTPTGDLYNDVPDRFADVLILVPMGYALGAAGSPLLPFLGWMAALIAILTAYVRLMGGALGLKQDFCGPLAKQHRMFVATVAALLCVFVGSIETRENILLTALGVIASGGLLTFFRRLRRISRQLGGRE